MISELATDRYGKVAEEADAKQAQAALEANGFTHPETRFILMAGKPYGERPIYNGPYVD